MTKSHFWTYRRAAAMLVLTLYIFLAFAMHGLRFELRGDELHFWPTSVSFSQTWLPSLDLLRNYRELNTPLPFIVFGFLEKVSGGGVTVGRWANYLCSLGIALLLCWQARERQALWQALIGIFIFPYFLGTSMTLYTDMQALCWTVLGIWSYQKGRPGLSALTFTLGIASRQYVLAFPIALLLYELLQAGRTKTWAERGPMIVAQLVAGATILVWFSLWGSMAPPHEALSQGLSPEKVLYRLLPENSLYFLAALGGYFVLPERLLRLREPFYPSPRSWTVAGGVVILAILFWMFPPYCNPIDTPTMGYMDKFLHLFLTDQQRIVLFFMLAALALLRFSRMDFVGILVWCNVILMLKSKIAWDKYLLLLLVILWWIHATESRRSPASSTADDGLIKYLSRR